MVRGNRSGDYGPLGRRASIGVKVFDTCPCGASTRHGRCENVVRHQQWESTKAQRPQVDSFSGGQQQQSAPSDDTRCVCGSLQLRYVEVALRGDAIVRDPEKCRAHQPEAQQG